MTDVSVTATGVLKSSTGQTKHGTAGATITAGMALYQDANDSKKLKPADAGSIAEAAVVGFALNGASSGQPVEYVSADDNLDIGATLVVGTVYVLSDAGAIAPAADLANPDYVTVVGVGNSDTNLHIGIIPSAAQVPA